MRCVLLLLPTFALAVEPFPEPINSESVTGEPMPAADAASSFEVPEGFHVGVFASEPDIQNPITFSWDIRGRLWVAENYTYESSGRNLATNQRDRVVILADTTGDGKADSRKVFTDQLSNLTSIEWDTDGLWALCPPRLLFLPDRDQDDVPDSPAEIVLDGFHVPTSNHHNFANGLRWGPDGWLYGRCGASAPGEVGLPNAPAEHRVPLRGGIWRFHPQRQVFESLTSGNTNPWGHDWDQHGELFYINTVNGHFWHAITGAHFVRSHTLEPNPYVYEPIDTHADHWHFDTTGHWSKSRDGSANGFGGGHAHVGMMIYQGANWPRNFRNRVFTLNLHGRRANTERLFRNGSGYVAKHAEDFLISKDPFFRGIELTSGPDGGVFVLDWSDTGECHENTGVHRTSGRVFKVTYAANPIATPPITEMSPKRLAAMQQLPEAWQNRMSRLALLAHPDRLEAVTILQTFLKPEYPAPTRLNALWTLHQLGVLSAADLDEQLKDSNEHLRAWAIRLLVDELPLDDVYSQRQDTPESIKLAEKLLPILLIRAREDSSALVRLTLASTLQRLPVRLRPHLATPLVKAAADADDHNLPLMIWTGLIPTAKSHPLDLVIVAKSSLLPTVHRSAARRLAEDVADQPAPLNKLLEATAEKDAAYKHEILQGMLHAFEGSHKVSAPAAWKQFSETNPDPKNAPLIQGLAVLFGDGRALAAVRKIALDKQKSITTRKNALRTLISQKPEDLQKICTDLLAVRFLNSVALRGLRHFDDPAVASNILKHFNRFHPSERNQAIETLVSRPTFAKVLLERVAAGKFSRSLLTPYHARQIRELGDDALTTQLAEAWGKLHDSSAEKKAMIASLRDELSAAKLAAADLSAGRKVFEAACATCHILYGQGKAIGPDLTGGGRHNLDYLLENIVTPSAVVTADFQLSLLKLKDGRTLTGVIRSRKKDKTILQTLTAEETILSDQIAETTQIDSSLMPDGLLAALNATQRRDLLAYLMHPIQVPRPKE